MTIKPSLRLAELGIELPEVVSPVAAYIPAIIDRGVIRTSGQLPVEGGELTCAGPVGRDGSDIEDAQDAAAVCALNALAAASALAGGIDNVTGVIKVTGYVASLPDFTGQPQVINGASLLFQQIFGSQHIRSAVGVVALPMGASVEVEVEFSLKGGQEHSDPQTQAASPAHTASRVNIHSDADEARRNSKPLGGCGCGGKHQKEETIAHVPDTPEKKAGCGCGGHRHASRTESSSGSEPTPVAKAEQVADTHVVDLSSQASSDDSSAITSAIDALIPGDSVIFVSNEEPLVMFEYLDTLDTHFHVQRIPSVEEEFRFLVTRTS